MSLFLTTTVTIPFLHCICVDSAKAGAQFQTYAMENCYYFAPDHMKPVLLSMIETAVDPNGDIGTACSGMVNYTRTQVQQSVEPWFTSQYQSAEQLASAIDYLMRFVDNDAGRCGIRFSVAVTLYTCVAENMPPNFPCPLVSTGTFWLFVATRTIGDLRGSRSMGGSTCTVTTSTSDPTPLFFVGHVLCTINAILLL